MINKVFNLMAHGFKIAKTTANELMSKEFAEKMKNAGFEALNDVYESLTSSPQLATVKVTNHNHNFQP